MTSPPSPRVPRFRATRRNEHHHSIARRLTSRRVANRHAARDDRARVIATTTMPSDVALDADDDALAALDVNAAIRAARDADDDARRRATATATTTTTDARCVAPTRARARPHVWIDVVGDEGAIVSCSRERLRHGFAGTLAEAAGAGIGDVAPTTPTSDDAGAAWRVKMTALKRVYDGLCAMDAFERGYRQGTRRTAPIGTPPPQTVEYLSRGPGYRGRDRGGDEIDEENDVDAVYEKIAPRIREALYSFQEEGVRFALRRRGRALIADQMGVGKTLQAIAIADAYRDAGPLLCVVPAAMRFVWADELERWLTDMTPRQLSVIFGSSDKFMLDKLAAESKTAKTWTGGRRVVVTSYHMLAPLLEEFLAVKWGCVIADESHTMHVSKKYGGDETKLTDAAWRLIKRAKYAVLTTGTPSLTKPFDMFYQIDALRPGMLGKKWDFAEHYCDIQFDQKGRSDVSGGSRLLELRTLLTHTTMVRRLKRDVMRDLPPKRRQVVPIDITQSIARVGGPKIWSKIAKVARAPRDDLRYDDGEDDDAGNILEEDDEQDDIEYVLNQKIGELERGKRVSVSQIVGMLKVEPIVEWLESGVLKDDSMQFVIFAHHQAVLDALEREVCVRIQNQNRGSYVRIDGSTPSDERKVLVDKFREGAQTREDGVVGVRVALLSVKAAGTGLDFSTASCVIFAELPDDASLLEQAEDRAHRRGNDSGVNVYFLCARGGACAHDEDRWARLESQLDLCREALDGDGERVGLNVEAYGTQIELEATRKSAFSVATTSKSVATEVVADALESAPEMKTEECPMWFEVSATSGRLHLHGKADGSAPLGASVSRSQLTRARLSAKYAKELPEPLASDPIAFAAAVDFSNTWNAMTARDRNSILARQQPARAHELNELAEALNSKTAAATSATGSTTRHGRLVPLPKEADWCTIVVTDIAKAGRKYEMRVPCRFAEGTSRRTLLCLHCVSDIDRITTDVARRVDLFCGEECMRVYDQGSSASALRRALFALERGVCVECKLDCDALVKKVRVHRKRSKRVAEILRFAPAFGERGSKSYLNRLAEKPSGGRAWECDHKIAVFEGGGTCAVENAQTLCVICHAKKTKAQAKQRAAKRKRVADAASIRRFLPSVTALPDSSDSDCVVEDAGDLLPTTTSRVVARSHPFVIIASSDDDVDVDVDVDDSNLNPCFAHPSRATPSPSL